MAKKHILTVDDQALTYAGKVIPLQQIAYFEKYRIKQSWLGFTLLVLGGAVVLAFLSQHDSGQSAGFLVGGVVLWIIGLLGRAAHRKYSLLLQTTAGDAPRLFETTDGQFLDELMTELKRRLTGQQHLPTIQADIKEGRIYMGDVINVGDRSNPIITTRGSVAFSTLTTTYGPEFAEAMRKLDDFIKRSGNRSAAELYEGFSGELEQPQPRKSVLRAFWESIKRELPTVVTLADVVAKMAALIA
jgi:hypothetical protein